eukprot:TRINITY_DN11535_c0_g1_i1.p1 TRINITY_DN11535_c0_g1~~TRINITY_DN11535_c0_g1_i1.p1  ORF type:complete len:718 (-),score=38.42 TRINITY_DN11535_c0_g1_i1:310-2463(-)
MHNMQSADCQKKAECVGEERGYEQKGISVKFRHECRCPQVCTVDDWKIFRPDSGNFSVRVLSSCYEPIILEIFDKDGALLVGKYQVQLCLVDDKLMERQGEIKRPLDVVNVIIPHQTCQRCQLRADHARNSCNNLDCAQKTPHLMLSIGEQEGVTIEVEVINGRLNLDQLFISNSSRGHKRRQLAPRILRILAVLEQDNIFVTGLTKPFRVPSNRSKSQKDRNLNITIAKSIGVTPRRVLNLKRKHDEPIPKKRFLECNPINLVPQYDIREGRGSSVYPQQRGVAVGVPAFLGPLERRSGIEPPNKQPNNMYEDPQHRNMFHNPDKYRNDYDRYSGNPDFEPMLPNQCYNRSSDITNSQVSPLPRTFQNFDVKLSHNQRRPTLQEMQETVDQYQRNMDQRGGLSICQPQRQEPFEFPSINSNRMRVDSGNKIYLEQVDRIRSGQDQFSKEYFSGRYQLNEDRLQKYHNSQNTFQEFREAFRDGHQDFCAYPSKSQDDPVPQKIKNVYLNQAHCYMQDDYDNDTHCSPKQVERVQFYNNTYRANELVQPEQIQDPFRCTQPQHQPQYYYNERSTLSKSKSVHCDEGQSNYIGSNAQYAQHAQYAHDKSALMEDQQQRFQGKVCNPHDDEQTCLSDYLDLLVLNDHVQGSSEQKAHVQDVVNQYADSIPEIQYTTQELFNNPHKIPIALKALLKIRDVNNEKSFSQVLRKVLQILQSVA